MGRALRQHDDGPRRRAKRNGARHRGTPAYAPVRRGRARIAQSYTASGEAYQLYLKGRYHVQKVALPEIQKGSSTWNRQPRSTPITPSPMLALRMPTGPHPQSTSSLHRSCPMLRPRRNGGADRSQPVFGLFAARHPRDLVRLRSASRRVALQARARARPGQRGGAYLFRTPALEPETPRGSDPGGRARAASSSRSTPGSMP